MGGKSQAARRRAGEVGGWENAKMLMSHRNTCSARGAARQRASPPSRRSARSSPFARRKDGRLSETPREEAADVEATTDGLDTQANNATNERGTGRDVG